MKWYTSDTHFGHENIIKYSNRPYQSVHEMNKALIENWNARVKPGDEVYHLGDFCFTKRPKDFLDRLNGQLFLVAGNHDREVTLKSTRWVKVSPLMEISDNGQRIVLCHFALEVWNKSHHGSWHLHGHSHGSLPSRGLRIDVGVDPQHYVPVNFEMLQAQMQKLEKNLPDYHKARGVTGMAGGER